MDRGQLWAVEDRGIDPDVVVRMGVQEADGWIYLPYYDARGRTVWYRLRSFPAKSGNGSPTGGDTRSTWSNPRGEHVRLYNVVDTQKEAVYLCEGETDTMTMLSHISQTGSDAGAVGVPGAAAFKDHWRWLFSNASVTIAFDGDTRGRDEARKLQRLLRETTQDVHVLDMPDGTDLNDLWRSDRLKEVV